MNDFRAEALRIYQNTSSTDSNRGVIAALLHLADLLGGEPHPASAPASTDATAPGAAQSWRQPALERLRTHYQNRSATADKLSRWLVSQGFDVTEKDVSLALWDLHAEGEVGASAHGTSASFRIQKN